MEQKHTPYYYVDTQFGDRYCLMDGNDMSKKGAYRMLDEIKKVAALTKENEHLTGNYRNRLLDIQEFQNQIKSLTEQVEKLKKEKQDLQLAFNILNDPGKELTRLREREKELVKALREFCQAVRKSDEKYPDWVGTSEVYGALFKSESLLSKFEVPNV